MTDINTPILQQDTSSSNQIQNGPGLLLKRTREKYHLSIDDMANHLKLRPAVIHALEQDDYSQISSPVFIRGYIRAYARRLDLDENTLLHMVTLPKESKVTKSSPAKINELPSLKNIIPQKWFAWITASIGVIILSIVIFSSSKPESPNRELPSLSKPHQGTPITQTSTNQTASPTQSSISQTDNSEASQ